VFGSSAYCLFFFFFLFFNHTYIIKFILFGHFSFNNKFLKSSTPNFLNEISLSFVSFMKLFFVCVCVCVRACVCVCVTDKGEDTVCASGGRRRTASDLSNWSDLHHKNSEFNLCVGTHFLLLRA